jgi:hypothetical protein
VVSLARYLWVQPSDGPTGRDSSATVPGTPEVMAASDPQQEPREPAEGSPDVPEDDPTHGDPETGSTRDDPSTEGTGLPPEGTDPMAGDEAPSG